MIEKTCSENAQGVLHSTVFKASSLQCPFCNILCLTDWGNRFPAPLVFPFCDINLYFVTFVRQNEFTGQSQWRDGVLTHQRCETSCQQKSSCVWLLRWVSCTPVLWPVGGSMVLVCYDLGWTINSYEEACCSPSCRWSGQGCYVLLGYLIWIIACEMFLTKVRLIGASFKPNTFLCALYQEVSHQLIRQISSCKTWPHGLVYSYL